jgi:coenzyme F420 hydrogenase subunit beta
VNSALKYVLGNQDRYVLIGLPCQIQSIRKAQALNEGLKNRISIIFGIACNHTPTFNATDFLLRRLRIPREKIAKLDYRSLGWPGGMNILMNDHEGHFVPFNSSYYWGYVFQKFFWQKRCMICNDKLCQLADIVFMDAWLPEFSSDKIGSSLIIVRSKNGEKLIAKAIEKGVVKLQPISIKLIEKSQILSTTIRKATARRFVLRYPFNNHLAIQNMSLTPSILDLIEAFHMVAVNRICGKTSMLSNTVIEFHKELWDIARFAKRLLKRI